MMEAAYEALIASYHNPLVPSDEKMLVSDTLQSMDNNYPFSKNNRNSFYILWRLSTYFHLPRKFKKIQDLTACEKGAL